MVEHQTILCEFLDSISPHGVIKGGIAGCRQLKEELKRRRLSQVEWRTPLHPTLGQQRQEKKRESKDHDYSYHFYGDIER